MNARAAEALYAAEAAGVKQITGNYTDGKDGLCALGVLATNQGLQIHPKCNWDIPVLEQPFGMALEATCPACGRVDREFDVVAHMNDDHKLTFAEIARKMGPDSV